MRTDDEQLLEELLHGHRPAVKQAMRAALRAMNDDYTSPTDDYSKLMGLAHVLAGGGSPPVTIIIAAIEGAFSLLRYHRKARRKRINRSRYRGMSAGLSAHKASKQKFKLKTGRYR